MTDKPRSANGFREIKRGESCPICEHAGRCKRDDPGDVRLCFRVADESANGFRKLKTTGECSTFVRIDSPADRNGRAPVRAVTPDLDALASRYVQALPDDRIESEADQLGVSIESLRAIGFGIDDEGVYVLQNATPAATSSESARGT